MPKWRALPLKNPVAGEDLWVRVGTPKSDLLKEARDRRTYEHNRVVEMTALMPVGYVYTADIYCAGCILYCVGSGVAPGAFVYATLLDWARQRGIKLDPRTGQLDEYAYDSDFFPKPIYRAEIKREGFPYQCGRCYCVFGMDPNEVAWCESCGDFWPKCRCR